MGLPECDISDIPGDGMVTSSYIVCGSIGVIDGQLDDHHAHNPNFGDKQPRILETTCGKHINIWGFPKMGIPPKWLVYEGTFY